MTPFVCRKCGNCCRWPGAVKLSGNEPDVIAAFLRLPVADFLRDYCEITPDRQHLSLQSRSDRACIFLTGGNTCAIDPVKPKQCRDFPERWRFPGWERECAGGAALTKEFES